MNAGEFLAELRDGQSWPPWEIILGSLKADHIVAKIHRLQAGDMVREHESVETSRRCLQTAARDGVNLLH